MSDPGEASSWRRILVVNNVLWKSFTTSGASERIIRKRRRIRAAAWAHGSRHSFWGDYCYILAVTNDYREVIFLRFRKPFDARDPYNQELQVEMLLCLSDLSESRLQRGPTVELQGIAQQGPVDSEQWKSLTSMRMASSTYQRIKHDITWSPWEDVDGIIQAMITCRNNGSVRHYLLHYNHEGPGLEKVEHHDEPFSDGPIIWISVCDHGNMLAVVSALTVRRVMAIGIHSYAVQVTPLK